LSIIAIQVLNLPQMPKFLFIATNEWVPWGGSELLWSSAAERLARRGMEVRVSALH